MRKLVKLVMALLAFGTVATAAGCYDYDDYYRRPVGCYSVWVPGHHSRWGRWVPSHWRCV